MMKSGFQRERQSGSSAFECGLLNVWGIALHRNGILFMGLETGSGAIKDFCPACRQAGLRLRHLNDWSVLECGYFLVNYDASYFGLV
jgi:hypothetical protein